MERKNYEQKMDIEEDTKKNDQDKEEAKIGHMEEELNNIYPAKPNFGKKISTIQTTMNSAESLDTNYSNNLKSIETINSMKSSFENFINNEPKFPPIFKINISKYYYDYKYNTEYFDEIYTNLLLDEKNSKLKIDKDYMEKQNEINDKMREILVDWLIEVHYRFHFKEKTLFQTIFIIDLFLSKKTIQKSNLQLLGVASLLIACKENEVFYPQVKEFLHITDNAYTKTELLNMELYILQILNFEIFNSTSEEFFGILSKALNFNIEQHFLGEYFLYSTLIDYSLLKYKGSVLGAACAYIVMKFYNINGYKDLYSTRIISDDNPQKLIKDCARELCFLVKKLTNSKLKSAKEKYSLKEYCYVAILCDSRLRN